MHPEDIANCQFVPISAVEKALNYIDNREMLHNKCKRDLLKLQKHHAYSMRCTQAVKIQKNVFHSALHNAIYKQDWNKLLYLLKRAPIWEQDRQPLQIAVYVRALAILLMYHPSAQAQDLLKEYFHLVCACRLDAEKNALMRIILTLPDTIRQSVYYLHKRAKYYQNIDLI